MNKPFLPFSDHYAELLERFVRTSEEACLFEFSELGQRMVDERYPLENIAEIQNDILSKLLEKTHAQDGTEIVSKASTALSEVLMSFGINYARQHDEIIEFSNNLQSQILEKTAELELSRSNLLEAQNVAKLGHYHFDIKADLWACSEELNNIFGIEKAYKKDIAGWLNLIHPDHKKIMWKYVHDNVLTKHQSFRKEYKIINLKTGDVKWVFGLGRLRFDQNQNPTELFGTIQDVTDRKKIEFKLIEAKEKAETANIAKSKFLSSMSHELRTPLNAVLGFAQLLQLDPKHPLTKNQNEYLEYIKDGGQHLLELINDLLDLAKIEADQATFFIEKVDTNESVKSCLAIMSPLGGPRKITIIDQFTHSPPSLLRTDLRRFKQILINLIGNAIKYNKEEGTVTVTWKETSHGFLRISIVDTGIGISPADSENVFKMFHRLNVDPMIAKEGAGVGLAVTKRLVERMAGRIGFESVEGEGSTFWVEFPLASNQSALIWTDTMHVGVDAIDKDHQRLIELLNEVSTCRIDDACIDNVIQDLIDYTVYHFGREEALMKVCEYPDFNNHCKIHKNLINKVLELSEAWEKDRSVETLDKLRGFLRSWLFDHILKVDTTIAPYTHGQDRKIKIALDALEQEV